MSMKLDCESAIYNYAPQIRQTNAALLGEHSDYVGIVLLLLRDHYHALKEAGETEWSIPDYMVTTLEEMKPYQDINMATKIVTKNSSTASAVPTASDLVQGELAVNVVDKRLFTENNAGAIVELGTNPSTIDINAGTIDGAVIGGTTPVAITGSTVTSTGNIVVTGTVDGRDVATDGTKLDGIEASADVTDTTNVVASLTAGSNITIAADGTIASTASGGGGETLAQTLALGNTTGGTDLSVSSGDNIVMAASSTVDGRDVSVDGTKLDGIEASADVTDATNVTAAGALMDSELTAIASVKALNQGVATTDSPAFAGLTVDTDTLAVDSTNNRVGIGTASPESTLEIAKNDQTNGAILSITNSANGGGWDAGDILGSLNFRTDDTSTTQPIRGQIKVFEDSASGTTYPNSNAMSFSTGLNNDLTERMRIASDGIEISNGAIALKNAGTQSKIDLYCESSNAHYTRIQAAPHSSYTGNVVLTLPASDGDAGQVLQTDGSGVMSWATSGGDTVTYGTFTPTVVSGTVNTANGSWMRVGDMVTVTFRLFLLSDTSSSTAIQILLPFTCKSGIGYQAYGAANNSKQAYADDTVFQITHNTAYATPFRRFLNAGSYTSAVVHSQLSSNNTLRGTLTYRVA